MLTNRSNLSNLGLKHTYVLTTMSWIVMAAFAAIPLHYGIVDFPYTDAYFEAVSGLTTTGASAIPDVESLSHGLKLWRIILHFLGGIGIIVLAIAILPALRVGGMQLFRTESTSDTSEKILPKISQYATALFIVYFIMCIVSCISLWAAGMSFFDAVCHSIAAIATGGFSNYNSSIGFYNSPRIEIILTISMFFGALPYVLFVQMARRQPLALWKDEQVRAFAVIYLLIISTLSAWLVLKQNYGIEQALRETSFNVMSVITTTGFASMDYNSWGGFGLVVMFLVTLIGGCTGSSTGGIKIYRFLVLFQVIKAHIHQLVHPHAVVTMRFNNKSISAQIAGSVVCFIVIYALTLAISGTMLAATGLDFLTSFSAAAATLGNVGPGLGSIVGPVGNYSSLDPDAKWILSATMLLGRLEIYTMLVLFSRTLWRS